jgi:hypothetical protein
MVLNEGSGGDWVKLGFNIDNQSTYPQISRTEPDQGGSNVGIGGGGAGYQFSGDDQYSGIGDIGAKNVAIGYNVLGWPFGSGTSILDTYYDPPGSLGTWGRNTAVGAFILAWDTTDTLFKGLWWDNTAIGYRACIGTDLFIATNTGTTGVGALQAHIGSLWNTAVGYGMGDTWAGVNVMSSTHIGAGMADDLTGGAVSNIISFGRSDTEAVYAYCDWYAFAVMSDQRVKEDIRNIPDATDKVMQMRGVTFKWKDIAGERFKNRDFHHEREVGLIAQEVQAVLPEVVHVKPIDGYLKVDYNKVIPCLIEAIKEQHQRVKYLKEQLI